MKQQEHPGRKKRADAEFARSLTPDVDGGVRTRSHPFRTIQESLLSPDEDTRNDREKDKTTHGRKGGME